MRMLDLFCGRWGWSKAFAARGWECVGVDLVEPPEIPRGCRFIRADVLQMRVVGKEIGYRWHCAGAAEQFEMFDFICASSPCEQFSVHGMKHFHPNPPYPELGIKLFNHTRQLCEASGVPYVMENVRAAQQFVGRAVHHCGPFYLWGNGVPGLMPQGIGKGISIGSGGQTKGMSADEKREYRRQFPALLMWSSSRERTDKRAGWATIPPELANCVADYAGRLLEMKTLVSTTADRGTQFR